jgi:hypothetical protein
MAEMKMKVTLDLSDVTRIVQVYCTALDCDHNTANRSHGQSIGHCDFKHICIDEDGKCLAYVPNAEAHGRAVARTVQPLVGDSE